jgi:uncharacterized protein YoxC
VIGNGYDATARGSWPRPCYILDEFGRIRHPKDTDVFNGGEMFDVFAQAGALLLQSALPDTIVTKTLTAERSWFETVTSIASGLVSLALLVLTVFMVPAAWNFRKTHKKMNELMERIYGDINPIMRHASSIADNVDYIATSVRSDVQEVRRTVHLANERLLDAVTATEQRVREFNALLEVVQQEAENTFVSAASTARGVRAGVSSLRSDLEHDLRTSRYHGADPLAKDLKRALELEDDINGDDDSSTPDDPQRPRIRSRS